MILTPTKILQCHQITSQDLNLSNYIMFCKNFFKWRFKTNIYIYFMSFKSLLIFRSLSPPNSLQLICWGEKQIICPVELSIDWILLILQSCDFPPPCISYEMRIESRDLVSLKFYILSKTISQMLRYISIRCHMMSVFLWCWTHRQIFSRSLVFIVWYSTIPSYFVSIKRHFLSTICLLKFQFI